ncbi:MAG: oligosaccharide flippase family protein [Candidatus Thiodiazotropha sp. (ex Myrtea sp. 'scaly one' KF741663)]|nr:oligosaccharide flippase family protein [Candidatus Thiodiazotropha sp. (ex Myrtea sp. 'scaly one' KF741663)]
MKSSRSLKWNTIANFFGIGYTTVTGIVIFPLYLQYLGPEAFGLVGFFTILQAWMQLLDMGMSPLLSRQAAYSRGHKVDFFEIKKLLRSLEFIVFTLALVIFLSISAISDWITNHWLNITSLPRHDVSICIMLMGAIIGLRFFSTLYRSGIQGLENQVRLNVANVILVSLKFIGALLLLQFITNDFVYFFIYQLIIGVIELICMAAMFYSLMPSSERVGLNFFWNTLKPLIPFAAGIAYTAGIWVLLTQLDKIILSSILPLSEYGYFTLVAIISAGILSVTGPISQAILPRMTHLLSQGREQDMLALYRNSTQIMAVIMLPLTGIIALFSTELLFAWSGDRRAAEWAGPILFWFALGNGIFAISAFQYYLQFAYGKLKMHVIYNSITASIQIPLIIYVAFKHGALGVAVTWFALRLLTFIIWTPIVHNKFAPGIHRPWFLKDIAPILICTTVLLLLVDGLNIDFAGLDRFGVFLTLGCTGLMMLMVNMLVSNASRRLLLSSFNKIRSMMP